ncbi:MAG: MCE family protein [Planctomycetaceae bacterium]|nr:MCE family protein [Planctomycetaceae bacterium]
MSEEEKTDAAAEQESVLSAERNIPKAIVRDSSGSPSALVRASKMWWVTLVCLVLAVWMTWQSIPVHGPLITIIFPEGHGLKTGDFVRHRGIEVGQVETVALSDDLSRITATVVLTPEAAGLAREGTRFWIVRPQVSLSGISGLETAVGAKYIGVSPGETGAGYQAHFEGLAYAPPDEETGQGIDVVLRSDSTHGINAGAPVTWRGVDVGQVLSVGLSPDARSVDVHVRIQAEYQRLLRSSSKFWVNSGLGVNVGLSGIKLNADSLSTIVRGGVSFTTLVSDGEPGAVSSGHLFTLHSEVKEEWLKSEALLPLIDFELPETVIVRADVQSSLLGIKRSRTITLNGVLVGAEDGAIQLLTAPGILDAMPHDSKDPESQAADASQRAIEIPAVCQMDGLSLDVALRPVGNSETEDSTGTHRTSHVRLQILVEASAVTTNSHPKARPLANKAFRKPGDVEDCCICRHVFSDGNVGSVIHSLGRDQLQPTEKGWIITNDTGDLTAWNGSPVVAQRDGSIIGLLCLTPSGPMISLID